MWSKHDKEEVGDIDEITNLLQMHIDVAELKDLVKGNNSKSRTIQIGPERHSTNNNTDALVLK